MTGSAPAAGGTGHLPPRYELPALWDRVVLGGLLALAAALRLPDLLTRGAWDADQGHDMLTWYQLLHAGQVPLLGPPTSIGDFHHGALYYYLLAPAAALNGAADPLPVATAIALAGIAAVGVTWWLARSIAGPLAGALAGGLIAISAAAIEESTFIWNPNLIALTAAVALAGAWRAWATRRARWWLAVAAAQAVTMQAHVLGSVLLPALAAFLVADAWRRPAGPERRAVLAAGAGGLGLVAASYIPLAVHEMTYDFGELRAAIDFLGSGGPPAVLDPVARLLVVALRVVSWPLAGLFVDGLPVAVGAFMAVVALVAWRLGAAHGDEQAAVRWLAATLAWSVLALTVGAASLATVVRDLPNDHYHAFADPLVAVLGGIGLTRLFERNVVGRILATLSVLGVVAWNASILPPPTAPDGGWPAARDAAQRILLHTGGRVVGVASLPAFKSPEGYSYPLTVLGARIAGPAPAGPAASGHAASGPAASGPAASGPAASGPVIPASEAEALVIVCDDRFREAIGDRCGGPAEDRLARVWAGRAGWALTDRFEAQPSRWISVYLAESG